MHLYDFDSPDEVLELYKKVDIQVVDFETKEFQGQSGPFVDTFALSHKHSTPFTPGYILECQSLITGALN